jgi:hypothetical protein
VNGDNGAQVSKPMSSREALLINPTYLSYFYFSSLVKNMRLKKDVPYSVHSKLEFTEQSQITIT